MKRVFCLVVISVLFCGCATTQRVPAENQKAIETSDTKQEWLTNLSGKLSKGIVVKGVKKIACIDFIDLQGRTTELGRYLAEQLSVEMVNEEGISVVDRANLKIILAEHKLTLSGLMEPENAKILGKFAGIDAILIGTVTILDSDIVISVKAISTETAQIVAAAKATIKKTSELQQLSTREAASGLASSSSGETNSTPKTIPSDSNAIATKDLGSIRIALLSVRQVIGNSDAQQVQLVFDLTNLNLKENGLIAAVRLYSAGQILIKSQLIDSIGQTWELNRISGLSEVRGGQEIKNGAQLMLNIMNGKHIDEGASYYNTNDNPWWGVFTEIPATQSKRFTMMFQKPGQAAYSKKIGDAIQFECELIIGKGSPEKPENCFVTTLMFDNISISVK